MRLSRSVLVLVAAGAFAGQDVEAQQVRFKGSTGGCFFTSGSCAPVNASNYLGLSFTSGAFDANTTSSGFLGLGGSANNLGRMSLSNVTSGYDGTSFLLQVLFDLPTLLGSNAIYTAAIIGAVESGSGGVFINFDNTPQVFQFHGPDYAGSFELTVNDVSVFAGDNLAMSGTIRTTVTPEPATMALIGTGLVGLIPAYRRRRRDRIASSE